MRIVRNFCAYLKAMALIEQRRFGERMAGWSAPFQRNASSSRERCSKGVFNRLLRQEHNMRAPFLIKGAEHEGHRGIGYSLERNQDLKLRPTF